MWISKKKWDALNERVSKLEKDTSVEVGSMPLSFMGYEYSIPNYKPLKEVVVALMERLRLTCEVEPKKPAIPEKIKFKAVRSK